MTRPSSATVSPFRARLLLIATALLFSTGGAVIKWTALNAAQVAGLRSAIAAAAILVVAPDVRRQFRWKQVPFALAYGATLLLFVTATKLTTSANAIFLQDTAPLFVLILGPLFLHERIRRSDLVLMAALACGMTLFFTAAEPPRVTAPDPARGNILALASAVTWALTITGLRWSARDSAAGSTAALSIVALGSIIAAAVALPFAVPIHQFGWGDAVAMLWLGLFQIALAYFCLTRGIRSVPVFEASALLLLEPALNPVWTWLVHGERPAPRALAGGAVILGATLLNAWWQNRGSRAAAEL